VVGVLQVLRDPLKVFTDFAVKPVSYIVFTDGVRYYAKNGSTGVIEYSDTDATKVIQYAIDKTVEKDYWGTVFLKAGVYYLTDTIYLWCGVGLVGEKHGWADVIAGKVTVFSGAILYGDFNKPLIKVAVHPDWVGADPRAYNSRKNFPFLSNIMVLGSNRAEYTSQNGIEITDEAYIYDFLMDKVFVAYTGGHGLYNRNPTNKILMSQCYFEFTRGDAIRIDRAGRVYIINSNIIANVGSGVNINGWAYVSIVNTNIDSNEHGVVVSSGVVMIAGCQITYNRRHGVFSRGGYTILAGNHIESNGEVGFSNVRVDGGRVVITGNLLADFRSPPRASFNVDIRGGETVVVGNNMPPAFRPVYGMINHAAGVAVIRNNHGYVNINSGVATIPAGSTRVTVSHGLVTAPSKVLVTPYGNARVWVENITATSFDIVTDVAPTADLRVAWYAEV
jgi:hypothetical protein